MWMASGAFEWAAQLLASEEQLLAAEQYFRLPLDWQKIGYNYKEGVAILLGVTGLDLLDYCLGLQDHYKYADELHDILDRSGSAWTVGRDVDGLDCLARRVDTTVEKAAHEEMERQSNAATYLRSAWHQAYGRSPNPSEAFRNAVRAVEAAARPVVVPKDNQATLGKMIPASGTSPANGKQQLAMSTPFGT